MVQVEQSAKKRVTFRWAPGLGINILPPFIGTPFDLSLAAVCNTHLQSIGDSSNGVPVEVHRLFVRVRRLPIKMAAPSRPGSADGGRAGPPRNRRPVYRL